MKWVGCLLVLAVGGSAAAEPPNDPLARCVQREDARGRLACYDAAMRERGLDPPAADWRTEASPPNSVAPEPPLPNREALFTRSRIEARLVDHRIDALGRWIFVLDNGQVWQQTDSFSRLRVVRQREPRVVIQERLMGGYTLKLAGNRGVQARRVK